MKCIACQTENKDDAKNCRKCGVTMAMEPLWRPSWQWHGKVLGIIYVALVVVYFTLSHFLSTAAEPYKMRVIPKDVTPWIK